MSAAARGAPAHSRGFTLLELLVAMFIAAVIFAMGYGAINQAVKNRSGLEEQQDELLALQTAVRTLEQDFLQLAQRPIRQPVGSSYLPALISNATGSSLSSSASASGFSSSSSSGTTTSAGALFALTRAGWTNPAGLQRPALQRVAYFFENGVLRREYWTVLDPTQSSQAVRKDLLTHLKSVSLRFMDQAKNWQPQWPPPNNANQNDLRNRPVAVEITLETEDWGKIVRVIEIAG
jgi:general secretion pathway protein J